MDITDWVLLILVGIYFLFNIKKVYYSIVSGFVNNGSGFTLYLMGFVAIFITGCIIGVTSPQYDWMPQWAFIWYIVGFFVYKFTIGFKD